MKRVIYDVRSIIDAVRSYYHARKGRDVMVFVFRGMKTDKEAREWLEALEKMEQRLSFPIINKRDDF